MALPTELGVPCGQSATDMSPGAGHAAALIGAGHGAVGMGGRNDCRRNACSRRVLRNTGFQELGFFLQI